MRVLSTVHSYELLPGIRPHSCYEYGLVLRWQHKHGGLYLWYSLTAGECEVNSCGQIQNQQSHHVLLRRARGSSFVPCHHRARVYTGPGMECCALSVRRSAHVTYVSNCYVSICKWVVAACTFLFTCVTESNTEYTNRPFQSFTYVWMVHTKPYGNQGRLIGTVPYCRGYPLH